MMSKKIWKLLYILTAKYLPRSTTSKLCMRIRAFYAHRLCEFAGGGIQY